MKSCVLDRLVIDLSYKIIATLYHFRIPYCTSKTCMVITCIVLLTLCDVIDGNIIHHRQQLEQEKHHRRNSHSDTTHSYSSVSYNQVKVEPIMPPVQDKLEVLGNVHNGNIDKDRTIDASFEWLEGGDTLQLDVINYGKRNEDTSSGYVNIDASQSNEQLPQNTEESNVNIFKNNFFNVIENEYESNDQILADIGDSFADEGLFPLDTPGVSSSYFVDDKLGKIKHTGEEIILVEPTDRTVKNQVSYKYIYYNIFPIIYQCITLKSICH